MSILMWEMENATILVLLNIQAGSDSEASPLENEANVVYIVPSVLLYTWSSSKIPIPLYLDRTHIMTVLPVSC